MLKTYLYVPQELNKEISFLAGVQKTSKAELMRNALREGLNAIKRKKGNSAKMLLKIAEIGRKHNAKGPKDLSTKMDKYLWG